MAKLYYSNKDLEKDLSEITRQIAIDDFKPDVIIGPGRGAFVMGVMLSHYYEVPFHGFEWQTRDHEMIKESTRLETILSKYSSDDILLVDEVLAVGDVDFLQLLDNWRQLLRYELGRERLESDLRQTLADLEQVVGGWRNGGIFLNQEVIPVPVPEDGLMLEEESKLEELPPPASVDEKNLQKDGVSEFK